MNGQRKQFLRLIFALGADYGCQSFLRKRTSMGMFGLRGHLIKCPHFTGGKTKCRGHKWATMGYSNR